MTADRPLVVVGAGYVGLVTAVGLAELGRHVTLVERDPDRLAVLRAGDVPFFEPGLAPAFDAAVASGRLQVTGSMPGDPGVVLVCVGTPVAADGRSDMTQLRGALTDVDAACGASTVLVIRSTLPVGTGGQLPGWTKVPPERIFTNPEFLSQGSALADFRKPSRIVIGQYAGTDEAARDRVLGLYAGIVAPVMVVDVAASELIKNGSNAFLALRLSFVNELAGLAEESGTDIGVVLAGIAADPRIGSAYMRPGFGFGGSCLPKELQMLTLAGRSYGLPMEVTTAASQANATSQGRFADRIGSLVGGFRGRTIGLLGLAFKANTDDTRESPGLRLAQALVARGARVRAFDPSAMPQARRLIPELETVGSAPEVFDDADAVVIATEWPEFAGLPFAELRSRMARPLIVDGRRLVDARGLEALGYEVAVLGTASGRQPVARH